MHSKLFENNIKVRRELYSEFSAVDLRFGELPFLTVNRKVTKNDGKAKKNLLSNLDHSWLDICEFQVLVQVETRHLLSLKI